MPVNTRSHNKKMSALKNILGINVRSPIEQSTFTPQFAHDFTSDIKVLLAQCEEADGKTEKMRIALQIMNKVNSSLLFILNNTKTLNWIKFAAVVYDKTCQFEKEHNTNVYDEVDVNLVSEFTESYLKAKKLTSDFFKNLRNTKSCLNDLDPFYAGLYTRMDYRDWNAEQSKRPRRNIPLVNYRGMDTIEPDSEYDGITDIYYDNSIHSDPDYIPEDEDEDEDEEEVLYNIFIKPMKTNIRNDYVKKLRSYKKY